MAGPTGTALDKPFGSHLDFLVLGVAGVEAVGGGEFSDDPWFLQGVSCFLGRRCGDASVKEPFLFTCSDLVPFTP